MDKKQKKRKVAELPNESWLTQQEIESSKKMTDELVANMLFGMPTKINS